MNLFEAIVLAIVQGLTEFLPISSSGHLSLARWLFGWDDPGLDFDVAVHIGTLLAILYVFRRDVCAVISGLRSDGGCVEGLRPRRLLGLGIVSVIPIVIVGALLYDTLESELRDATAAAAFLIGTGLLILLAEWRIRRVGEPAPFAELDRRGALAIGLAQCLAILPGISRSGVCMVAGMALGYSREAATHWAFWLAMPTLAGAGALTIRSLVEDGAGVDLEVLIVSAVVSFVTALFAIRALLWLVRGRSLLPFAAYCLIAGTAALIALASGV